VTAALELALVSKDLTNMEKLDFVRRKVEFMKEIGDVGRYVQVIFFSVCCGSGLFWSIPDSDPGVLGQIQIVCCKNCCISNLNTGSELQ
jgi:hypothetical protein